MTSRLLRVLVVWVAVLVLGASWAVSTGRYGGPDEPAHTVRAAAVARGELVGDPVAELEAGYRMVEVPRSIASGDPACYRHDPQRDASCAVASTDRTPITAATSAGTFPPTYYAAVGLLARGLGLGDVALGHRLAAVVLVALALAGAHLRLARWPDRGRAALLWASITPAAWFLTGVVNTNGLEVALFVVAWVLAAELLGAVPVADPARHISSLGWLAAAVIAIRPVAVTGVLTLSATLAVGVAGTQRISWRDSAVRRAAAVIAASCAAVGIWSFAVDLAVRDTRTAVELGLWDTAERAARGAGHTLVEAVGSLGWAEFRAPWPATLMWIAAATLCASAVARHGGSHLRHATLAWCAGLVLGPVVFEIVTASRIGFVWQGRYSIGSLLGIGALGAAALAQTQQWSARVICALAPVASTITLWATTRRYVSGTDGSWTFDTGGWWPPIGPWLPLVIHASSAAVLALLLVRAPGSGRSEAAGGELAPAQAGR